MALGPVIGGALTQSIGWRSIFWVNLPIGVGAMLLAARYIPESRAPRARRVDAVGQLLALVILTTITYGVIEGPPRRLEVADDLRPFCRRCAVAGRVAGLRAAAP
jgi:MFS family permease